MEYTELAEFSEQVCVRIISTLQDGRLSEGSGVVVTEDGFVATASHVISSDGEPAKEIFVRRRDGGYKAYEPLIATIDFNSTVLTEPIQIDLSLLRPINEPVSKFAIKLTKDILVGTLCVVSGYPQERGSSLPLTLALS